jgi:hypothetical protein|nr:MAG TPA: hypothetical protein [Bacteriophage sp.]
MEWYADREVTSKEREAIDEALSLFNCDLSDDDIQRWIDDDTISLNTCRNGCDVVWILLEDNNEACIYVDNLKKLTNEEIKNQLL